MMYNPLQKTYITDIGNSMSEIEVIYRGLDEAAIDRAQPKATTSRSVSNLNNWGAVEIDYSVSLGVRPQMSEVRTRLALEKLIDEVYDVKVGLPEKGPEHE